MPRDLEHPPSAARLSGSMRDIGHSLETAIADLVDNSISAGADCIDIIHAVSGNHPMVIVADNGKGMTEAELMEAMRHGAGDPAKKYGSPHDLGRFGLGLKTASFSQCRTLTVLSTGKGVTCGAEWSLDRIDAKDEWLLSVLDEADMAELGHLNPPRDHGTMVIWRDLDRMTEHETGARRDEIVNGKFAAVERHLALVFHRFLAGEIEGLKRLAISINGHPVEAFDPFCRKNPATQVLPEEILRIGSAEVRLQPYILPHLSRLSAAEQVLYTERRDFISDQGCYVYRNGRLVAWGGWFRLARRSEATSLARVQIDFPGCLDETWAIDIRKSHVMPPHVVRERLRQIIPRIIERSTRVHRGHGQRLARGEQVPLWERHADRDRISYVINDRHPLIQALHERLQAQDTGLLRLLLEAIAASLPIELICSDHEAGPREGGSVDIGETRAMEMLRCLWQMTCGDGRRDREHFFLIVRSTHLFEHRMDMVDRFMREVMA